MGENKSEIHHARGGQCEVQLKHKAGRWVLQVGRNGGR